MQNPPFSILAMGQGWLVVDKPAGISIHNDPGQDLCSKMADFLQAQDQRVRSSLCDTSFGLHAVHRLDKQTSGCLLLAGRQDVFSYFSELFSSNQVVKHYLALVHGKLGDDASSIEAPPGVSPTGAWCRWTYPLASKSGGRRDPQGQGRKVPATTLFRVLGQGVHYSFLECRIQTGRTHQIRRHAVMAGHAVVGDSRYGSRRACRFLHDRKGFSRLALHASRLKFNPPESNGKSYEIHSRFPEEICRLMEGEFAAGVYSAY